MFKLYEQYLEAIDKYLADCFASQQPFIHCKSGCANCCEVGEYPFSRLEMEYLMDGYAKLPARVQKIIKNNFNKLLREKMKSTGRFLHACPFLIDKKCALYNRRGLTCRAFGLASFEEVNGQRVVKLPACSNIGLNYSEALENGTVSVEKFQQHGVTSPINHSLSLNFFHKDLLNGFEGIEFGEIRPILAWFD